MWPSVALFAHAPPPACPSRSRSLAMPRHPRPPQWPPAAGGLLLALVVATAAAAPAPPLSSPLPQGRRLQQRPSQLAAGGGGGPPPPPAPPMPPPAPPPPPPSPSTVPPPPSPSSPPSPSPPPPSPSPPAPGPPSALPPAGPAAPARKAGSGTCLLLPNTNAQGDFVNETMTGDTGACCQARARVAGWLVRRQGERAGGSAGGRQAALRRRVAPAAHTHHPQACKDEPRCNIFVYCPKGDGWWAGGRVGCGVARAALGRATRAPDALSHSPHPSQRQWQRARLPLPNLHPQEPTSARGGASPGLRHRPCERRRGGEALAPALAPAYRRWPPPLPPPRPPHCSLRLPRWCPGPLVTSQAPDGRASPGVQ